MMLRAERRWSTPWGYIFERQQGTSSLPAGCADTLTYAYQVHKRLHTVLTSLFARLLRLSAYRVDAYGPTALSRLGIEAQKKDKNQGYQETLALTFEKNFGQ